MKIFNVFAAAIKNLWQWYLDSASRGAWLGVICIVAYGLYFAPDFLGFVAQLKQRDAQVYEQQYTQLVTDALADVLGTELGEPSTWSDERKAQQARLVQFQLETVQLFIKAQEAKSGIAAFMLFALMMLVIAGVVAGLIVWNLFRFLRYLVQIATAPPERMEIG